MNFFDDYHEYRGKQTLEIGNDSINVNICDSCLEDYKYFNEENKKQSIEFWSSMECKYCQIKQCKHVEKMCTNCKASLCFDCTSNHKKKEVLCEGAYIL